MEIDLFTLIAQIVNFLVLLLLLRIFLYRRVIEAMERREERIASRMEEADAKARKAVEEADEYREKKDELDRDRERIMEEAEKEAESRRKEMVEEARREVRESRRKWYRSARNEKNAFLDELRRRAVEQITAVAARVLQDHADRELQEAVVDVFIARLHELEEEDREELSRAAAEHSDSVVIRSAFELSDRRKKELRESVRSELENDSEVEFRTQEELICGVELRIGGRRVSWNVASYLQSLEEELSEAFVETPAEESEQEEAEGEAEERGQGAQQAEAHPEPTEKS